MSSPTAIGQVSRSLRRLLRAEMKLKPKVPVTILAPDEVGTNRQINLFLYQAQENSTLKNLDWQVKRGKSDQLVPPPLSLSLFYLMTPYAPNDSETGNIGQHEILGDAMRVFYEHPVVPKDKLTPGLKDAREEIRIMLRTLDLDELSRVWATFTQPFRLSVLYEVSVVQIDMLPKRERTMAPRVRKVFVCKKPGSEEMGEIPASFQPPTVAGIEPRSGPAGTEVTVHGAHLDGWQAHVTMSLRSVGDGQEISGDSFQFTVPAELDPGFHEMQIDVSRLHRSTFFFEVTG